MAYGVFTYYTKRSHGFGHNVYHAKLRVLENVHHFTAGHNQGRVQGASREHRAGDGQSHQHERGITRASIGIPLICDWVQDPQGKAFLSVMGASQRPSDGTLLKCFEEFDGN